MTALAWIGWLAAIVGFAAFIRARWVADAGWGLASAFMMMVGGMLLVCWVIHTDSRHRNDRFDHGCRSRGGEPQAHHTICVRPGTLIRM